MDIKVEDSDLTDTVDLFSMRDADHHIIVKAEAHWAVVLSMMTRRTHGHKGAAQRDEGVVPSRDGVPAASKNHNCVTRAGYKP